MFNETEPGRWFVRYDNRVAPILGWICDDAELEPVILIEGRPYSMTGLGTVDWMIVSAKELSKEE